MISRRHCLLSLRGGQVWVEDLGSRNGTRLNDEALVGPRPLASWDRLELPQHCYLVRLVEGPESPPSGQEPTPGAARAQPQTQLAFLEWR
jgi:pSer/pThr/pTyr-binding forkhead associated (FHA) protein